MTIKCPSCASDIEASSRYCSSCGSPALTPSATPTLALDERKGRDAPSSHTPSSDTPSPRYGRLSSSETVESRFVTGTVLAGRYRIVGILGKGGMGEIYRADDLKLGQAVALKFLPESIAANPSALARLHNEVRMARQVSHPNVCRVYDIGEERGLSFLSMEFVDGEDLASLLRRIGRLPKDKAVEIARQLCAGLASAHERGVLHRDLKPANVMLDRRGKVRITDFGLASLTDHIGPDVRSGTPAYMAPEHRAGKEVTIRSDIYSLGLVLYEIFTGRHALESRPSSGRGRGSEESAPASPSSLVEGFDPVVERVILRCLSTDPHARPVSALAVAAALPGGDPLAAALAAGETPSPEMVAAAGETGGLTPVVAWSCLAAVGVGLLLLLLSTSSTRMIEIVGLEKPPEVLAERAREIVKNLGYEDNATDSAYGFVGTSEMTRYFEEHDTSQQRWSALASRYPSPIQFWYRTSPRYLVPAAFGWENESVGPSDPPRLLSGMVFVGLDTRGRLGSFERVPPQRDESTGPWPDPDWASLLREAGFDIAGLKPVTPLWNPLMDCDARATWEGIYPSKPELPLRFEAGAYHGKPVFFEQRGPWDKPDRMEAYQRSSGENAGQYLSVALVLVLLFGGALLARRNLRLGRGDRRGAFRLAAFLFITSIIVWLFRTRHVPDADSEFPLFFTGLGSALFGSVLFWMLYVALEPFVRRFWPDTLISWSKVLAGHFHDPLVGRDILIGVLLGLLIVLTDPLGYLLDRGLGYPPAPPNLSTSGLLGVRDTAARTLDALSSLGAPLVFLFILVLVRVLLKRTWLAVPMAFTIFGVLFTLQSRTFYPSSFTGLLFVAALLFVLVRFGALAAAVGVFVANLLTSLPVTPRISAWYAGYGLFALAVVAVFAAYGFHTALAGRPMLGRGLIQE